MPPRTRPTTSRPRVLTILAIVWLLVGLFQVVQVVQLLPTLFGDEPMARAQFESFFGPHHDFDAVLAQSPGMYGWRALWSVLTIAFVVVAGCAWRGAFDLLRQHRMALRWLTIAGALATVAIVVSWVGGSAILTRIAREAFPETGVAQGTWNAVSWVNAVLQAAPAVVLTRVTWLRRVRSALTDD